ncbi:MAG TPA: HEAT repeat domain-containing protein [Pyrinomonadaceae bacterium]|jgi:hypothetical protein
MRQTETTISPHRLRHACALLLVVCLCALAAFAQQNDNSAQKRPAKNIAGMSSSDAPGGSRVTITSDGALNDYSAYRSGDRFYVVIPQASAKGVGGVRGRGFEGAQVQRRGQDVVLSFKLQPGASARVDQRFNRLVVNFNAPDIGAQPKNTNQPAQQQPTPNTSVELSGVPQPTPGVRPTPRATPTPQQTGILPPGTLPTPLVAASPLTQATPPGALPSPSVSPSATPVTTPEQIAQLQPTPAAPVLPTTTSAPVTTAAPVSLGTTVLRNWPWLLIGLIVLGALALFVFARGKEGRAASSSPADTAPAALKETPRPTLPTREQPVAAAAPSAPVAPAAVATTASAAPPVVAQVTNKKGKKGKKGKRQPEPMRPATVQPTLAATEPQETETLPAAEASAPSATAGATVAAAVIAAAGAAALTTEAEAPAAASEQAVEETRKLLAGEEYDAAIVGATDAPTRQVVAAELMTALATESEHAHGERARAAFLQHGYFDDVTRDLRAAEEPQQRASAARTLGLVGDKMATPHLVAALEDPAPEVRRSAVEALTELQDPAATGALEALRWRENSRQLPRKLIQKAIEACAVATALAPVETTPAPTEETAPAEALTDEQTVEVPRAESAAPQTFEPTPHAFDQPTVEATPAAEPERTTTEQVMQEPPLPALAEESTGAVPDETLTTETAPDVAPEVASDISPAPVIAFEPDVETTQEVEAVEPSASTPADLASLDPVAPAELAAPETLTEPQSYAEAPPVELSPAPAPPADDLLELTAPEAAETEHTVKAEFTEPTVVDAGPVEPPAAPAPEETKEIAEFVITSSPSDEWIDIDVAEHRPGLEPLPTPTAIEPHVSFDTEMEAYSSGAWPATDDTRAAQPEAFAPTLVNETNAPQSAQATDKKGITLPGAEDENLSIIPKAIQLRLESDDVSERAASVLALAHLNTDEAFQQICAAFDDSATEVREAAARALYSLADDRADSFTRALREAPPERRRRIGASISSSGLADEAVSNLTGESRDKTYDAFSLLFLMAKAGETAPLIHAIETHPENEVRLAVVKLLALSGQHEILPSFRRLAVRGSLPTEVRSAVMEAIYQISSQPQHTT